MWCKKKDWEGCWAKVCFLSRAKEPLVVNLGNGPKLRSGPVSFVHSYNP